MSVTHTGSPSGAPAHGRPEGASGPSYGDGGGPVRPGDPRRPPSKRGRWVLLGVGVAFVAAVAWILTHNAPQGAGGPGGAAAGGAGGRGGGRGGAARGQGGVTSVNIAQTTIQDVPIYLTALGTVTPEATVTVRTQVAGQLFSVAFREGQIVRKGQLLAQVDPRPYQQALAQAQGNLTRDEALLTNAQLDLKRYRTLLSQDSIASQQVDTQAALVRQDEGTVATDRASVGSAKLNLAYTRITAPVGGKVGLRQVDPGNYVTSGDTNGLVTITQIDPIDVVFTIPEDSVSTVNQRMTSGAALQAVAYDRAGQTQLSTGVLSTLDNQIDTTTGTVKAKARFPNETGALYPNQFVNARLLVNTLAHTVVAPTAAVLRGQQGLFVWTVDRDRTVHMRTVQTGPAVGDITAITQGLNGGETVVTDGSDRLREDGQVMLPGDCPPSADMMGGRGGRGGHGGHAAQQGGGGFFGLFKKPAPPAAKPGVSPDGQKCNAVDYAGGGANALGAGGRQAALYAQLGLDPTQKAKIDSITAAAKAQFQALRAAGNFQALRSLRQTTQAQVDAVLRPDQRAKLAQLRAQQPAQGGGGRGGGQGGEAALAAPQPASSPSSSSQGSTSPSTGGAPAAQPMSAPAQPMRGSLLPQEPGVGGALGNPAAPPTHAPPAPVGNGTAPNFHGARRPLSPGVSASPQAEPPQPTAAGQEGGRGGGGRMSAMLGQLNLDPAQQAKAQAIFAQARQQAGDDPDARRQAMRGAFGQLEAILRPDQKAKLAQLRAQMRQGGGPGAGSGGGSGPGGL